MPWVLPAKDTPPILSMMLLVIKALLPAVLIRIPVAWPTLLSEKPLMVTPAAWMVMSGSGAANMPVMVDSTNGFVRPATGFPAWAPLRMRDLGIITFSAYTPAATSLIDP